VACSNPAPNQIDDVHYCNHHQSWHQPLPDQRLQTGPTFDRYQARPLSFSLLLHASVRGAEARECEHRQAMRSLAALSLGREMVCEASQRECYSL